MSEYEMFLLGGSSMIVLSVVMFFSAASRDNPITKSLAIFFVGGILLYFAEKAGATGIQPGDIPLVFKKFVMTFFN